MAENIELQSYRSKSVYNSEIEEYHDAKQDVSETTFSPTSSTLRSVKEFDFFTEIDVKSSHKNGKKKKPKQKDIAPNLMDIITTELSSITLPVRENVIMKTDVTAQQQDSFLERPSRIQRPFQRRPSDFDSESGWDDKLEPVSLTPVFPKVQKTIEGETKNIIDVQYVKPTLFDNLIMQEQSLCKPMKFLDIELKDLTFHQHHEFSLEKLLCSKLIQCFNEYNNINKILDYLERDIKVNRDTRDSLKEDLIKVSPDKKESIRFDETVRKYTGKLLELKDEYLKVLQKQKEIIHKMIILWCDIETVRDKTETKYTNYILIITKEMLNQEDYDDLHSVTFNLEYSDMLERLEYEYVSKYLQYKEVKHTQNLDDSAKKRISKPKLEIDEEILKEEVGEIVNNIVEKEKYHLYLKEDIKAKAELDSPDKGPKMEYFFEVYVDDVFVCESEHFSIKNKQDFSIELTESFSVQILPNNSKLTITLNENDNIVSPKTFNLNDIKKSFTNAEFIQEKFVANEIIELNPNHIGSGHNMKEIASQNKVRLKSSNLFTGNLYTTCEVNVKVGWSDKLVQSQDEVIKSLLETDRKIKRILQGIDKPNTGDIIDIICKIYDKNISNDENLINNLLNMPKTEFKPEDTFPIDVNSPEITRLKLLHLRNTGAFCDVQDKVIPLHASQISTEQLNILQKITDREASYLNDKYSDMDPIELQRFIGTKFVQRLNKNLLKNLNEYLLKKTTKDVVRDFRDLSLRSLFPPSPSLWLSSISSSTRHKMLNEALNRDQEITVTVLRALNLPDRQASVVEDDSGEEIAGFKVRPLRPFVTLSYKGQVSRSGTARGCHPTWNQTLRVSTRLEPLTNLQISIFDECKPIIDQHSDASVSEQSHEEAKPPRDLYLGIVSVPLRAVLTQTELRGVFKVSTPPLLFSYETTSKEPTNSLIPDVTRLMRKDATFISLQITTSLSHLSGLQYQQPIEDDYIIKHLNTFVTEYTNEFPNRNINLTFIDSSGKHKCVTQFLQPIPLPDLEYFPKKSRIESASKSSVLSKSSSSKDSGNDRKREVDAIYASGEEKGSLYSSFSWKNGDDQLSKVMDVARRYVALIPTYEVTESHTVTLLGLELLKVVHGSPLDHTILLASYFLHLGVKSFVAIGVGLPRGRSSYVLTAYDSSTRKMVLTNERLRSRGFLNRNDGYIWSVYDTNGQRSELRDVGCPLKAVEYVFDTQNIWVNVQPSMDCESVSFDFTKCSDWRPVFNKSVFVTAPSPINGTSLYRPPSDTEPLRQTLEDKLKDKIQRWRPRHKTVWNRYVCQILRDSLPSWEHWAFHPTIKPALGHRLKQLTHSYKVFGFPLNLPYSTTKAVISAVKSTSLHVCADPSVEYALAVEVYSYPNNIISVWVYLATISRL